MSSKLSDRVTLSSDRPLQMPGRDRIVREFILGGPEAAVDARMFLTKAELTHMLEVANSSMTGRVILNRPGVKVRLFETEAGHRYEAWTIVAAEAKPERHAMIQDDGSLKFKIGT